MAYRNNAYEIPGLRSPFASAGGRIGRAIGVLLVVLLGAGGVLALVTALSILRGWVLTVLWGWFLLPLGAPNVGIAHATGISLVCQMMLPLPSMKDTDGNRSWGAIIGSGLAPLIVLLIGWIVHSFM